MPLGLPVDPDVYSKKRGWSAGSHSGSQSVVCPCSASDHHISRPGLRVTSWPVRLKIITVLTFSQPSISARSVVAFNSIIFPPR